MNEMEMPSTPTLPEFIRRNETKFPQATSDLTNVLLNIALGTKIASRGVNRAGLASMMGLTGSTNVQGEEVQKLDEYCDQVFGATLGRSGEVISMVSEEREQLFAAREGTARSKYVVAFDPLDGSSNIDVNVSIGTIWGIYRRKTKGSDVDPVDTRDFFQKGRDQIAAGYCIYGSSTMFVFSTGEGVNGFTLDPTIGEFVLTHPNMTMPQDGSIYSCNEGNYASWSAGVKAFVDFAKTPDGKAQKRPYSARYVGSLVADFHRTLLKGGIFFYPADVKNPAGKLRLLYECSPMSMIAEQAGGKASNGSLPILDLVPDGIHQRTPFFIGSTNLVDQVEKFLMQDGVS